MIFKRQAFKGTIFTDKEKTVSANIVNFLWPFVQKHTIDNHLPEPHILIYAPLAALANYIATITAAGVYDVPVDDTNWITNSNQAEKNKPVIFLTQIKYRKAKPGKAFIKLNFEARIKGKKGNVNISKFTPNTEMSISKIEATAEKYTLQVKDLTKILTPLHKEISQLELQRMDLVRKVGRTAWDPGSANYQKLKEIRHEIATKQFEAIKLEKALAKARNKTKKKFLNGIKKEDYIEKMDLLPVIMRHLSSQKRVVFLGTDPGTIITSITSPRPLETIFADINCFNILASLEDNSQNDNDNSELTPHKFDVEFLPKPFKITSGLINNRAYGKITAQEWKHIQLPSNSPKPTLIHCIGHWQGINRHSKQGMKKIQAQHRNYRNVAIANEFNTKRFASRGIKYTTQGRDTNAAENIALSGASIVLAADLQPLPPFHHNTNHTRYNLANELLSVMTPELVPHDFICDE
ncbi:13622_t:CDS:2 [Entrophospora sp. SA101]|nr:13622_t:CDS:2 [Entrophospora sp. SA101]